MGIKYLFILGRNFELSIAEIKSYFGKDFISSSLNKNGLLVELKNEIPENTIDKFGSIISIGKILGNFEDLDKINIYMGEKNNFNYILMDYSENLDKVQNYLKKRFRSEKLKATEKRLDSIMKSQEGEIIRKSSSKLLDEEYFIFDNYFGKIIQKCDYVSIEKRDMEKPVRRESLSISPRLAKIMVNLSQVKEDELLIDVFCGIGVILQEALLQNIRVVGIDKDKDAIKGAKENLEWFGFSKEDYKLFNADSKSVQIQKVAAMVSEPELGNILRKIPTKENAQKTLNFFERLMVGVLNNIQDSVKKRFVFTAPLIRISKKRLGCDIEKILERTNLELVEGFPIQEFRENQIVGREIFVLEKN
jgi:tRNA G10  N-methylase Trm11